MRVRIAPPCSQWAADFESEKRKLWSLIGEHLAAIEHIGSTSIPGLPAKPIIDIQVGLRSLADFDNSGAADSIGRLGYLHRVDLQEQTPYRRFFKRENSPAGPDANMHAVEATHPWWKRHLLFRDFLRENEDGRLRYANHKLRLGHQDWHDVNHYNAAKEALIWQLEDEAFRHFDVPEQEAELYRRDRQ